METETIYFIIIYAIIAVFLIYLLLPIDKDNGAEQTNGKNWENGEEEQSYITEPTLVNNSNYAVLGMKETASKEEIRKRYHELAKQYHPDTTLDEMEKNLLAEKFVEIQNAYNALMK